MIEYYCIIADGKRWGVRHDHRAAFEEAHLLARLYPDIKWEIRFTIYASISDAINDNVMICPECGELMQHCIGVYHDPEF